VFLTLGDGLGRVIEPGVLHQSLAISYSHDERCNLRKVDVRHYLDVDTRQAILTATVVRDNTEVVLHMQGV
jgi:hypothetical protein